MMNNTKQPKCTCYCHCLLGKECTAVKHNDYCSHCASNLTKDLPDTKQPECKCHCHGCSNYLPDCLTRHAGCDCTPQPHTEQVKEGWEDELRSSVLVRHSSLTDAMNNFNKLRDFFKSELERARQEEYCRISYHQIFKHDCTCNLEKNKKEDIARMSALFNTKLAEIEKAIEEKAVDEVWARGFKKYLMLSDVKAILREVVNPIDNKNK